MSKLKALIELALRQLGICEIPMGSNDVKYNHEYWGERSSYADLPWCVVFCWWLCRQVGVPFPNTAHCNGVESYARENGRWVTGGFQPGDFIIFDYDGDGSRDHIGLVIEANGDSLTTVEGNYGDKVAKVNRRAGEIVGAYRPIYGDESQDTHEIEDEPQPEPAPEPVDGELPVLKRGMCSRAVAFLQGGLRAVGCPCGDSYYPDGRADGEFGQGTEDAVYRATGKTTVGPEEWIKLIGG